MVEEVVEMHAIIRGRVQGVGFRATTQLHATKMGFTGTVKNLPDGSVEIVAQGLRENLEKLLDRLKADGGLGQIENISVDFYKPLKLFDGFKILF